MCCVFAPISGCHLNPAVSIGLWAAGRFSIKEVHSYIIAQVIGGYLPLQFYTSLQMDNQGLIYKMVLPAMAMGFIPRDITLYQHVLSVK